MLFSSWFILLLLIWCHIVALAQETRKKIIHFGVDAPQPLEFANAVLPLEHNGTAPIDGTAIDFVLRLDDGSAVRPFRFALAGTLEELGLTYPYNKSWFQESIDAMRSVAPSQIQHNFLRVQSRPGNVDWFDDDGWALITETFRHAAYAAQASGMEGIIFDPEPYVDGFAQFDYILQTGYGQQYNFDDYAVQARQRGRQVMQAMLQEFADVTLVCLFLNAYLVQNRFRGEVAINLQDPKLSLVHNAYGLLPYFLDGWLEASTPAVKIVDGNEEAYYYNSALQFDLVRQKVLVEGQQLVSPENREIYQQRVQMGSALFLDAYGDEIEEQFRVEPPDGVTIEQQYVENVHNALRTVDEYVWTYAEYGRFWPLPTLAYRPSPFWHEKLPFLVDGLREARSGIAVEPTRNENRASVDLQRGNRRRVEEFAVAQYQQLVTSGIVATENKLRNPFLLRNQDGWGFFESESFPKTGEMFWVEQGNDSPGALRIQGSRLGSAFQAVEVTAGDILYMQTDVKRRGWAEPSIAAGFRRQDREFLRLVSQERFLPVYMPVVSRPKDEDWQTIAGAFAVPQEAVQMVFSLNVLGQRLEGDAVDFDNVVIVRVGTLDDITPADLTVESAVANPSFEDDLEFWSFSNDRPPTITTDASTGQKAVRIDEMESGITQSLPVTPGQTYAMNIMAKIDRFADGAYVGVKFQDAQGKNVKFDTKQVNATNYESVRISGQVPPLSAAMIVLAWKVTEAGILLVDDVVVLVAVPVVQVDLVATTTAGTSTSAPSASSGVSDGYSLHLSLVASAVFLAVS